jgi:hypothetical protein
MGPVAYGAECIAGLQAKPIRTYLSGRWGAGEQGGRELSESADVANNYVMHVARERRRRAGAQGNRDIRCVVGNVGRRL